MAASVASLSLCIIERDRWPHRHWRRRQGADPRDQTLESPARPGLRGPPREAAQHRPRRW